MYKEILMLVGVWLFYPKDEELNCGLELGIGWLWKEYRSVGWRVEVIEIWINEAELHSSPQIFNSTKLDPRWIPTTEKPSFNYLEQHPQNNENWEKMENNAFAQVMIG